MRDAISKPAGKHSGNALSSGQTGLWLLHQLEPLEATYNLAYALELRGPLDVPALTRALETIVHRHDALRTTFSRDAAGDCRVWVAAPAPLALPLDALDGLDDTEREASLIALLAEFAQTPMELDRGPLFQARLARLGAEWHVLVYTVHHLVFDGASAWIFQSELSQWYRTFSTRKPTAPTAAAPQFRDFVSAERRALTDSRRRELLSYWREALRSAPGPLALPGRPGGASKGPRAGRSHRLELSPGLARALTALSRKRRVSLFVLLLAAFDTLLMRWCRQTDLVVGVPFQGRTLPESDGVIGYFVNALPVRADLSGDPRFDELLVGLSAVVFDALEHQDLPFSELVRTLAPARSGRSSPFFEVSFQALHDDSGVMGTGPGWDLPGIACRQRRLDCGFVPLDLVVTVRHQGEQAEVQVEYAVERFEEAFIASLFDDFGGLLEAIARDPERRLSEYTLTHEAARGRSIVGPATPAPRPFRAGLQTIPALFEAQARRSPEAAAVRLRNTSLSYGALDRRANRLAHRLLDLGVGSGEPVAVLAERSLDLVVALLGILKAGGAYLPVDPHSPDARLRPLLREAGVQVALTDGPRLAQIGVPGLRAVRLGEKAGLSASAPHSAPNVDIDPESPACVMFTSGSTGRPKGVEVPHRAVANLVTDVEYVPLHDGQTTLQLSPLAFDASTFEIWGPLLNGGAVVLYPPGSLDLALLERVLNDGRVTCLFLTTTLFNTVIDERPQALSGLSHLLTGGEQASLDHVRRARRLLPNTRLVHVYGPTECTTFTTFWPIPEAISDEAGSIPIGRPIGDARVYILDSDGHPVPVGVAGELTIAGAGVAAGYRGRPDLTRERFLPDPFRAETGHRMYRSGDRARCLNDGNIDFLGRDDQQVKVRGYRIELGEIETALLAHSGISGCVAVTVGDGADKQLVAYVVFAGRPVTEPALRRHLESRVPTYMLPSRFVTLDRLPTRPSGKVDRSALPAPSPTLRDTPTVSPGTAWERVLVELWQTILGVDAVGITDNFFELGGNSLQAVRLVSEIEWRWGWSPPIGALIEGPTIAQLARLSPSGTQPGDAIVTLQPSGAGTPMFFVGGADGYSFTIRQLSQLLGNERPILGVHYLGAAERKPRGSRVEDIAQFIVAEIRESRPNGPYVIAGYSFGCAAALEAARVLRGQGAHVSLVVLLEPSPLSPSRIERISRPLKSLTQAFDARGLRGLVEQVQWGLTYRTRWTMKRARRRVEAAVQERSPIQRQVRRSYRTGQRALDKFTPRSYAGPVAVFYVPGRAEGALSHWVERVCSNVRIYQIPGDHHSALQPPHVYALAERVRGCLAELLGRDDRAPSADPGPILKAPRKPTGIR